jgi:hypothetical protein
MVRHHYRAHAESPLEYDVTKLQITLRVSSDFGAFWCKNPSKSPVGAGKTPVNGYRQNAAGNRQNSD